MSDFDSITEKINNGYNRLGHTLGWRFLTVSKQVLESNPEIVFLTLNPGGSAKYEEHPVASCEQGCAYTHEQWSTHAVGRAPLQIQVQQLFSTLATILGRDNTPQLMEQSLLAYFVPFRSPSWEALSRKDESLDFAKNLWASLFKHIHPRLIIVLGHEPFGQMATLMRSRLLGSESTETGWGTITAETNFYGGTSLVRLPHLSRFKLFGREDSQPRMERLLERAYNG